MLACHILIPVLCAMVMNGFIYTDGKNKYRLTELSFLPPGYMIGIIWTILFALLGYVHFLLYNIRQETNYGSISVVFFIIFSLTYPVIQAINQKYAYLFNLISLILSFMVGYIVMMYSKNIFLYMIPLLIWLSYVNLIVLCNILKMKIL